MSKYLRSVINRTHTAALHGYVAKGVMSLLMSSKLVDRMCRALFGVVDFYTKLTRSAILLHLFLTMFPNIKQPVFE